MSKRHYSFVPKLVTVFKEGYSLNTFFKDLNAGIIVGIVAVPLALALAIASGVKPEQGLYTAVIAGLIISLLGGSRFQIGGPTGAFIVVVFGIVTKYGYDGLAVATIIAGFLLILMALLRAGSFIKFIPYPVTAGFTNGIAVIILISQIKDFLGLQMGTLPVDFIKKLAAYGDHIGDINLWSFGIGMVSLLLIIFWPKLKTKIPGTIVAILAGTIVVNYFGIKVETIGSQFGSVPSAFPVPGVPEVSWELIKKMFSPAITIALLAGIESLLSAVVADGMTGRRHRSNAEILAQGVANIASAVFGGIPATGAIARTATNIRNGGQSPVSGIIHAITVLLIMVLFAKWAAMIPMAVLSAVLISVAYQMSEIKMFKRILKYPKSDAVVLYITFFLTVLVDLTVAIQVGVLIAIVLLVNRLTAATHSGYITNALNEIEDKDDAYNINKRNIPDGAEVFEIDGVFFFGAIEAFRNAIEEERRKPKVFILRMRKVLSIDAAGLKAIEEIQERMRAEDIVLVLSGIHAQPYHAMNKSGFLKALGERNVTSDIDAAIIRSNEILNTGDLV